MEFYDNKSLLGIYLRDIARYQPLTIEQEQTLAERARQGDQEAREQLIEANLTLVVNIARQHLQPEVEILDLIQEGNIGLIRAVDKFEPRRGYRLSTLAMFWIRKQIQRYLDGKEEETTSLDEEIEYQGEMVFLSDIIEDQATLLGDPTIVHVETKIKREETQQLINFMLSKLEAQEKLVLQLLYGLDGYPEMSREDVAKLMGVSPQYISRTRINTLRKLKKLMKHSY